MGDITTGAIIAADIAAGLAFELMIGLVSSSYIDLANNYYDLYKEQRNFYFNNFQAAGELPLTTELFNVPFYVPLYNSSGTYTQNGVVLNSSLFYYQAEVAIAANFFLENFQNHLRMFNSTDTFPKVPYLFELSEIGDDWLAYFFRYEEHRRDVFNERRYAQQMDDLSYGVKEGAQVERGLATSFLTFDEAQGHLVSAINSTSADFFAHAGYTKQVQEVLQIPKAKPDNIFSSNFDTSAGPTQ